MPNLNTLIKVASAIGNDPYFVATVQSGLNAKQNVINDNGLSINKVDGLQSQLNSKYNKSEVDNLLDNVSVSVSNISGLQTALDSKASTTQLNSKQDVINDNGLSMSKFMAYHHL